MCKVFGFTNMDKIKVNKHLIKSIANNLIKYDNDGFGYAIVNENGLFGERYCKSVKIEDIDCRILNNNRIKSELIKLCKKNKSNMFGQENFHENKNFTGIFHSRKSTNDISLINTHPFINDTHALIHNGIVYSNVKYDTVTTCDSELILKAYETGGIDEIQKNISGGFVVLMVDIEGKFYVIKNDGYQTLYMTYAEKEETHIFCTEKLCMENILKDLKIKFQDIEEIDDNQYAEITLNNLDVLKPIKTKSNSTAGKYDNSDTWKDRWKNQYNKDGTWKGYQDAND